MSLPTYVVAKDGAYSVSFQELFLLGKSR
jgi:hypothetical protein